MKAIHILLFFILCFFNIINICDAAIKYKNEVNNKFGKRSIKKNLTKRKLDDSDDFYQLKIKIDTAEMEETCTPLNRYLDNIINAMKKAKEILEEFILIKVNVAGFIDLISRDLRGNIKSHYLKNDCEIEKYDLMFDSNFQLADNNYFIFGKCVDNNLNEESASLILDFHEGTPYMGLILFNINSDYLNNLDESKFTLDNLTNLMLHHFVRLLGFNSALLDPEFFKTNYLPYNSDNEVYYLKTFDTYNFDNVINYAKNYFNCPNIEKINLYVDEENRDEDRSFYQYAQLFDIVGLYWPKELFAGELLTKYDYSEEKVLSGFTWAFLDDLPYLKVTKDYNGEITRFKNNGCECKCSYFDTGVYADDFWDCSACLDGFFISIKSSESDKECVSNDNKDYYFLYNEESQIYKKCELEIQNCQKCSSETKCTLCKNGYELEDKDGKTICEKKDDNKDDDDGLSTGAIIGIVFGCVGFLLIVALTIFCLIMRKKENEKEKPEKKIVETAKEEGKDPLEDDIKVIEYDKKSEIMEVTSKRTKRISNKGKNNV